VNASMDIEPDSPFWVGDWQVDPPSGRLRRGNEEVKLEPRVMDLLVQLALHPGEVMSRETLEAKVWPGMVVGYDAISQSMIKLRKALQDDSRDPRYIETISKKGYRLIAPVQNGEHAFSYSTPTHELRHTPKRHIRQIKFIMAILALLAVSGLLLIKTIQIKPPPPATETPSVIVLPFKNLSTDPQQDYLTAGLTDDLITDLSRVSSIRVIARQSSYYFKHNPSSLAEITRQLGVLYIVQGSVRKVGKRIRINVRLNHTGKNQTIWAERFDADTGNIFSVQDKITHKVMDAMLITLANTANAKPQSRGTINFDAYDAFLMGQQYIQDRSRQGYEQAMQAYRRAIQLDPNYARAYGAMAVTLTRGYRYQWTELSLVEARERALELAQKAVALSQNTPQIYWSLGYVHLHRREFDKAEQAIRQSVALSPNYADGYALLANTLNWRAKHQEAINFIQKAMALNPYHTFQYPSTLGEAYYHLGQYDRAAAVLRQSLERNENALNPHLYLAACYVRLQQREEAEWEIKQINLNHPEVNLSMLETTLPYEHKQTLHALLNDLQKAGLPQGN